MSSISQALALAQALPADPTTDDRELNKVVSLGPQVIISIAEFLYNFECPIQKAHVDSLESIINDPESTSESITEAELEMRRFKYGARKYMNTLQNITNGVSDSLEFCYQDYLEYAQEMLELGSAPDDNVPQKHADVMDILLHHTNRAVRLIFEAAESLRIEKIVPDSFAESLHESLLTVAKSELDTFMKAPFDVTLTPPEHLPVYGIRDITETSFGSLMRFEVIIAKVYSSRPRTKVAVYNCERCQAQAFQAVYDDEYNPVKQCESTECSRLGAGNGGELQLIPRLSRMTSHEIVLAQEPSSHVPQGNIPRRRQLIIEGPLTGKLSPGMICTITGIPEPKFHSQRGFGDSGGKVRDTVILVQHIHVHKRSAHLSGAAQKELDRRIEDIVESTDHYERLANSIAPSVFGLMDVKKALLLQLVGAPKLETDYGLNIRGEIHILMMGDPGVAKSQLLGKVTKLAPRSSYTSGKSASGVGLTASVYKDPSTGEFSLEGGSVVIADTGICGIDEFDKLDEGDRTAIHEVMEQQTVSISKAGLNVQLNARTAILAAANPTYGRYDATKSVMQNINLPHSLVSRFDLQFLLLDTPNELDDSKLSMHILDVHRTGASKKPDAGRLGEEVVDPTTLRYFITRAQTYSPILPKSVADLVVNKYVDIREHERVLRNMTGEEDSYTTPRTLFSIIRLSQALARVRFSNVVIPDDVHEACRLMEASTKSILSAKQKNNRGGRRDSINDVDPASEILTLMRQIDGTKATTSLDYDGYMTVAEVENRALSHGWSKKQVLDSINGYVDLAVLTYRHESNEKEVAFADRLEKIRL